MFLGAIGAAAGVAERAQSQEVLNGIPPTYSLVDKNGVDLTSGTLMLSERGIAVGQTPGGLSFNRYRNGGAWVGNVIGIMYSWMNTYHVSYQGKLTSFTNNNGAFSSDQGDGSSLSFNATLQIYTYTTADGAVLKFSKALAQDFNSTNEGEIISASYPSGEVDTFAYKTVSLCVLAAGGGCSSYAPANRLQSVTNNLGYQLKFQYSLNNPVNNTDWNAFSAVIKVTAINNAIDYCDPPADSCSGFSVAWPSQSFAVDTGNTSAQDVTDAMGRVTRYTYNSQSLIVGIKRASSSTDTTTVTYDGSSRVASVSNGTGAWTYAYSTTGGVLTTTVTDPLSHTRVVASSGGLVSSDTDGNNKTVTYTYDSNGRLTQAAMPEGDYFQYIYDFRGNVTSTTHVPKSGSGLSNVVTSSNYPSACTNPVICNKPTSTIDALGNQTDYTYDPTHGGLLTAALPAAATGVPRRMTTYSYTSMSAWYKNGSGSIVQAPAPVYRLTGASGCQTASNCVGGSDEVKATIGYGTGGSTTANNLLPISTTLASGDGVLAATTAETYDAVGNLLTIDGPLSGSSDVSRYRYDADRELVGVVAPDPDGLGTLKFPAVRLTYNADGQVILTELGTANSQSDADWQNMNPLEQESTSYDSASRKVNVTFSSGGAAQAVTQFSYDNANRLDCTAVRMNPSYFASPPSSACALGTPGTSGADRISKNAYDAADQLVSVTQAYGTGSQRTYETLSYTNNGRVQTLKDAMSNLTTYEYDGFDRLTKVRFPTPAQSANSSSTTDYESYSYDTASRMTTIRRRSGDTITLVRDNLGQITEKDIPGGTSTDVYYGYDLLGRVTYAHYGSAGGAGVDYAYDALSRLIGETASSRSMSYQYDLAGERTRITWPDSLYVTYDYDLAGRVTAIRENGATSGAGVLAAYVYDDLGRRVAISRAGGIGAATSYASYDGADRLTSLSNSFSTASSSYNVTLGYSYNASSQATSRTSSNESYTYHPATQTKSYSANGLNQYASVSGANYTYDGRGNLTSDGTRSFTYDLENRLLTASAPTAVALSYDPAGRLQTSTANSSTTTFLYSGDRLVAEYGSSGMLRRYVPGPDTDETVVWYEGSGTSDRRWLQQDRLGSAISYSDSAGNVSSSSSIYGYGPYGEPNTWSGSRYRFTGQLLLPEAQLYHYKSRVYDPGIGRFLQPDTIGYLSDVNSYAYAGNDPVNLVDPFGMDVEPVTVTAQFGGDDFNFQWHSVDSIGTSFDYTAGSHGIEGVTVTAARRSQGTRSANFYLAQEEHRNACGASESGWAKAAEFAETLSGYTGTAAIGAGVAGLVTSETGVGFVTFEGAAAVLEVTSKVSGFAAAGFQAADHNWGGAAISLGTTLAGAKIGGFAERTTAKAVAAGKIGERHARALNIGVSADATINEQIFGCAAR